MPRRATAAAGGLDQELPTDTYTRWDIETARRLDRERQLEHDDQPDPIDEIAAIVAARRQPWRQHAACRGVDTDLFFPGRGDDVNVPRAVCDTCPVKQQCLDAHIAEKFGMFGGLSERERRKLRRELAAPKPELTPIPAGTKRCNTCGDDKPYSDYHRWSNGTPDGFHYMCKPCRKAARNREQGAA
jgi:WhiB family redox-sensing transcriptional regulator